MSFEHREVDGSDNFSIHVTRPAASVEGFVKACSLNYGSCTTDCEYVIDQSCLDNTSQCSLAASVCDNFVECSTLEDSQVSDLVIMRESTGTSCTEASSIEQAASSTSVHPKDDGGSVTDLHLQHINTQDCNQVRVDCSISESIDEFSPIDCCAMSWDSMESVIYPCPVSLRLRKSVLMGGEVSQLKPDTWFYYLQYERDKEIRDYLWNGVSKGFDIVDRDIHIDPYECSNYSSCLEGPAFEYVDRLILRELEHGKYVEVDVDPVCVHSLGAVAKSNGSFRPIMDCRRPLYRSINDYMDTTFESFSYASTDQVCDLMTKGCYMATVDIASAYRSVSINPDQWKYQTISWPINDKATYLFDVRLSFGLRCAPFIFTRLSDFVVRTMGRLGFPNVISYIDDFIIVEPQRDRCVLAQTMLFELLGSLGFEVSWTKCTAPSTKVRYLGIDFDSSDMTLSLPKDKMYKLVTELIFFEGRTRTTKRQLQRLCGILSHASKVVRGGRVFSRRIIDMLKGLPSGNPRVRITEDFLLDLEWWRQFSEHFNGKACLIYNKGRNYIQMPV